MPGPAAYRRAWYSANFACKWSASPRSFRWFAIANACRVTCAASGSPGSRRGRVAEYRFQPDRRQPGKVGRRRNGAFRRADEGSGEGSGRDIQFDRGESRDLAAGQPSSPPPAGDRRYTRGHKSRRTRPSRRAPISCAPDTRRSAPRSDWPRNTPGPAEPKPPERTAVARRQSLQNRLANHRLPRPDQRR